LLSNGNPCFLPCRRRLAGHNVGKAILVEDVIDNLLRDGDHYAKAALTFTAGASRHGKLLEDMAEYTA
jgi:hypothetical protein